MNTPVSKSHRLWGKLRYNVHLVVYANAVVRGAKSQYNAFRSRKDYLLINGCKPRPQPFFPVLTVYSDVWLVLYSADNFGAYLIMGSLATMNLALNRLSFSVHL